MVLRTLSALFKIMQELAEKLLQRNESYVTLSTRPPPELFVISPQISPALGGALQEIQTTKII